MPANGADLRRADGDRLEPTTNGGVKGRVTIASNNNVLIANNINPVTSGTDVLGLIAANEMIVAKWCPTNLSWTAATISEHGEWRSRVRHSGMGHGTMNFKGSTASYGGMYNGSRTAGYMTSSARPRNYEYDETLLYLQPPWFPTIGDSLTVLHVPRAARLARRVSRGRRGCRRTIVDRSDGASLRTAYGWGSGELDLGVEQAQLRRRVVGAGAERRGDGHEQVERFGTRSRAACRSPR